MLFLLLGDSLGQVVQFTAGAIDLAPRLFQLLALHLPNRAGKPPAGTAGLRATLGAAIAAQDASNINKASAARRFFGRGLIMVIPGTKEALF